MLEFVSFFSSAMYGCLLELTIQLAVIMVGKQIISNLQEVCVCLGFPLISSSSCHD